MNRRHPRGSHSHTEERGHVKEQPFHRAGCAGFTWRGRAGGRRGHVGWGLGQGEVTHNLGLKGSAGSQCAEREGRASPAKAYEGDCRAWRRNRGHWGKQP